MPLFEPVIFETTADFYDRRDRLLARMQTGEKLTLQDVAEQLGVPLVLVEACAAIHAAGRAGSSTSDTLPASLN